MFGAIARRLFGTANERIVKGLKKDVEAINALEAAMIPLSDDELRGKTEEFRARLADGIDLDDLMVEAFAVVREAAKRVLGQRHFDVQLMGGMVLHNGKIAEMRTGEGKTLVATLPVYLNALTGAGVHVVTVNDYLAMRDAEWMGRVYRFLGLTVGIIHHGLDDDQRRTAYACDVTYGTNNELGFDYLRDNMKFRLEEMVHRPFNYAIVDEVDSILIDEARTPLIISGPTEDNSELYRLVDRIIPLLVEGDFEKDEKARAVTLTETGTEHAEQLLVEAGLMKEGGNLYDVANVSLVHHVNQDFARPQAVHQGCGLHRQGRQGRHHRRIHRPHDGRTPLFRGPASGLGSQGRRHHPERKPDSGLHHLPESVPSLSQAVGHDRHRHDRSRRIPGNL